MTLIGLLKAARNLIVGSLTLGTIILLAWGAMIIPPYIAMIIGRVFGIAVFLLLAIILGHLIFSTIDELKRTDVS
jgi:hypothetical protein